MGSGKTKRRNTPDVPRRTGGLMTAESGPATSCPEGGRAELADGAGYPDGTRGQLHLVSGEVLFLVDGKAAGKLVGRGVSLLARCLEREFTYEAELETDGGTISVHYWMA
jgi:hypothetical protein